jgi:hypothetical protein
MDEAERDGNRDSVRAEERERQLEREPIGGLDRERVPFAVADGTGAAHERAEHDVPRDE